MLLQEIFLGEHLVQRKHSQQRYGKLGYHKDARHGAELVVHREVVDKQVGEPHEIVSPREQHRKNGNSQKCPFHRSFHHNAPQHEERENQRTHIHRAVGHRLIAEVLGEHLHTLRIQLVDFALAIEFFVFRSLVERKHSVGNYAWVLLVLCGFERRATVHIWHKQRESFTQAVTPLGNVVLIQTAVFSGLLWSLLGIGLQRSEFAVAATYSFL